ncbi:hypothetical protein EH228_18390 [Erwinia endophytica]|uniref:hypothetical protein n=1 Tax=Erwinia endophytica TaxID=1563158 RepID=UPI001265FA59|nr:hypothetical protein [Erwinia endophytica]KAB8306255.1 hypothetical protein EH228_18390 [Erwinia endophytica]
MKKLPLALFITTLCGCVDLGRVGLHPDTKTVYFDGHPYQIANCLDTAALRQHLSLMPDDPLPGGTKRYKLQDKNDQDVAWIDVAAFNDQQTNVDFFYAPHAPDVSAAIVAMISQCKNSRY